MRNGLTVNCLLTIVYCLHDVIDVSSASRQQFPTTDKGLTVVFSPLLPSPCLQVVGYFCQPALAM